MASAPSGLGGVGLRVAVNCASMAAMSAVHGFVEQGALLGVDLLALLVELQPLELRHLEAQLVDLGVSPVDLVRIVRAQQLAGEVAQLIGVELVELWRSIWAMSIFVPCMRQCRCTMVPYHRHMHQWMFQLILR